MIDDLRWLGIDWEEGPDCGGPYAPYSQSERHEYYLAAWQRLRRGGHIYPCFCSRKDRPQSASAPNDNDDEPLYPETCRNRPDAAIISDPRGMSWRFRIPNGNAIEFTDLKLGPQHFVAGKDFGDFLIWRRDDVPAYQLAVVVDDALMQITEVVRGADLLKSTARQILIWQALANVSREFSGQIPSYYHCDLVRDGAGVRLAKRHDALSIRHLRETGTTRQEVLRLAGVQ